MNRWRPMERACLPIHKLPRVQPWPRQAARLRSTFENGPLWRDLRAPLSRSTIGSGERDESVARRGGAGENAVRTHPRCKAQAMLPTSSEHNFADDLPASRSRLFTGHRARMTSLSEKFVTNRNAAQTKTRFHVGLGLRASGRISSQWEAP